MADFVAVLKRTIDNLGETTPEVRRKVYEKARATIGAKLAAITPPPPAAVAERQRKALEDAIAQIEREFEAREAPPPGDALSELDALFAELTPARPTAEKASAQPAPAREAAGDKQPPGPKAPAMAPPPPAVTDKAPADPDETDGSEAAMPAVRDEKAAGDDGDGVPANGGGRRRAAGGGRTGRMLALAAVLVVCAGAGYALWMNKDGFADLFGGAGDAVTATGTQAPAEPPADAVDDAPTAEEPVDQAATEPADEPAASAPADEQPPADGTQEEARDLAAVGPDEEGAAEDLADVPAQEQEQEQEKPKFTQRLNADGSETDSGPAGGEAIVGEGTSLAAATQAASGEAADASAAEGDGANTPAPSGEAAVPVAQKAIFYEERTSVAEGTADAGTVVWSLVQESPGGDQPAETVIRGEATIPEKDLQLRLTVRRNTDQTLPASHIVELIFLAPDDFASGPIDNVLRMTMKGTEQAAGNPLIGIPAKIADGFFLVALNDGERELAANTQLLSSQSWIDVPIVYKSGRRALITLEKGIPGEKVFQDALKVWAEAKSG